MTDSLTQKKQLMFENDRYFGLHNDKQIST